MMVAGLAFSVGMRGPTGSDNATALAPIGYVGIFYGVTFLVAAAAVLALQQLADAVDSAGRFAMLADLGCDSKICLLYTSRTTSWQPSSSQRLPMRAARTRRRSR